MLPNIFVLNVLDDVISFSLSFFFRFCVTGFCKKCTFISTCQGSDDTFGDIALDKGLLFLLGILIVTWCAGGWIILGYVWYQRHLNRIAVEEEIARLDAILDARMHRDQDFFEDENDQTL